MKRHPSPQLAIDYLTACRYSQNRHYTVTPGNYQYPATVVFHKGVPYQPHDLATLEAYGFQVLGGVLQK